MPPAVRRLRAAPARIAPPADLPFSLSAAARLHVMVTRILSMALGSVVSLSLVAWGGPARATSQEPRQAATKEPTEKAAAGLENPADAEPVVYGNRSKFFDRTPPAFRPDPDWRSAFGEDLADAEPQWSQGFEELIIRDYFGDRKGGVFLDVGCSEPRRNSTTYYLENELGWTGIGIDASPWLANAWAKHRPNSKFVSHAVTDVDGEQVTFYIGFVSALDEEALEPFGGKMREIEVTTMTLDTLLEENGVEELDFLSMDIEGAEPAALEGFDIERYRPELACIEATKESAVTEYFLSHGYELIEKYRKADRINLYFRPSSKLPPR